MTWFDLTFIIAGWGLGNYLFNNFSKHLPWRKRLLKLSIILAVLYVVGMAGRGYIYLLLGFMLLGMTYLHAVWFPQKGINGRTAEPYDRYLHLVRR